MQIVKNIRIGGAAPTLRYYGLRLFNLVCPVFLSKVSFITGIAENPHVKNYENRVITETEYHSAQKRWENSSGKSGYHAAFQRGDLCVATFSGEDMVGYNFYTPYPTNVNDETEFFFSGNYQYSYAAYTLKAHRNLGTAPSRWAYFQSWSHDKGINKPLIYYIDLCNLTSLRAEAKLDSTVLGYAGYIKLGKHLWHWRSPGCKKHKVGFRPKTRYPV